MVRTNRISVQTYWQRRPRLRIGVHWVVFVSLLLASIPPLVVLYKWMESSAIQKEIDYVEENHLIIARNLAIAMERYANDVVSIFEMTSEELQQPEGHTHNNPLDNFDLRIVALLNPENIIVRKIWPTPNTANPSFPPEQVAGLRTLAATNPGQTHFSGLQIFDGTPHFFLVRLLPDEVLAIAVLSPKYLIELQKSIKFGERGHSMMVDQNGLVIAHPNAEWQAISKDVTALSVVQQMIGRETGVATFYSPPMQADMISGFTFVPRTGWGVMVPQPMSELIVRAKASEATALYIVLVEIFVIILLSWWLSSHISTPIRKVVATAKAVSAGDLNARVVLKDSTVAISESQLLGKSFNQVISDLQHDRSQLTDAIEALDDGFVMFDKNKKLVLWNTKYAEIYDFPEEVLRYGTHYSKLTEHNIQSGRYTVSKSSSIQRPLSQNEIDVNFCSGEEIQQLSDGRTIRAWNRMMADGNCVGLRVDITDLSGERDKAFADLEKSNSNLTKLVETGSLALVQRTEQLAKLEKVASLGRLTAGIAHDFNNLLAAINWSVELFELNNPSDRKAEELTSIREAVISGAAMTKRLVDYSTKTDLIHEPTNIDFIIESKTDVFTQLLGETIDFTYDADAALWPILVDANRFQDAIYNLVVNAKEAMPDGGDLCINAKNVIIDDEKAKEFGEVSAGDFVLITVSDTGYGIELDHITSVFDPFYTTSRFGEGRGLGLSMVYGFAKQSEGHVLIESEPHVSTVVKLYLPRATEPVQIEAKPVSRPMTTNLHVGSRILVVEDNLEILNACTRALEMEGFEVVTALTGRDAMVRISEEKPFDLLFSDIVLPGDMSGIDVQREAFLIQPNMKSILTTGYADVEGVGEQTFITGTQILKKPYTRKELLDRIEATLAQS